MTTNRVRTAVIPAAGLGTRFLPATKSVPKEMLTVVDRPSIQWVVEEAVAAGVDDIVIITSPHKKPLEDHFDRAAELEAALADKGKTELLDEVRRVTELATFHFTRQGAPLGLGHAVGMAARHVRDEPFAGHEGAVGRPHDPVLQPHGPNLERGEDVVVSAHDIPLRVHRAFGRGSRSTVRARDRVQPDPATLS